MVERLTPLLGFILSLISTTIFTHPSLKLHGVMFRWAGCSWYWRLCFHGWDWEVMFFFWKEAIYSLFCNISGCFGEFRMDGKLLPHWKPRLSCRLKGRWWMEGGRVRGNQKSFGGNIPPFSRSLSPMCQAKTQHTPYLNSLWYDPAGVWTIDLPDSERMLKPHYTSECGHFHIIPIFKVSKIINWRNIFVNPMLN